MTKYSYELDRSDQGEMKVVLDLIMSYPEPYIAQFLPLSASG